MLWLRQAREWVDDAYRRLENSLGWHPELQSLTRYALLGAGKALRPALLYAAYADLKKDSARPPNWVLDWGLALEMVHTYSLIHDDLPAMDNDDFRRGRPTLHRLRNEATAVLCGDALLTGAFEVLALSLSGCAWEEGRRQALWELSHAAGGAGMVSGQYRDMNESQVSQSSPANQAWEELKRCHQEKTGALFGTSLTLAWIAAQEGPDDLAKLSQLRTWGVDLGFLFQVTDDVLDATASKIELGKTPGKDAASDKRTILSFGGLESAQKLARDLAVELQGRAAACGLSSAFVSSLLDVVVQRRS